MAVLDSGIDTTHPDLADAVVESRDFTGSEHGADDYYGHGTHVASIITGDGPRYRGVAPDAKLRNGKVLDDYGYGYESGIIAGMEWAAHSGADVVNMSIGSRTRSDGADPMSLALNSLTAETGTLFVVSAGNEGPGMVGSPGAADAALTVGAVDRNDQLAEFSSTGPRARDGAIKPDITAPGVGIVAAKAANGVIGDPAEAGYVSLSGTSMAAPHVAGAAAILAGEHPGWTADRLKAGLMATARPNPGNTVFEQGTGRVDVAAATSTALTSSPATLNIGLVQWPHDDDQPVANTLTYTNSGAGPVTLDVTAEITGPDGKAAPAGMFTLSASRVTVPAGGSAQVGLTVDTRGEHADGSYAGTVVASSGDRTLRTPVAVQREVESYDVTFDVVDQQGNPTSNYEYTFASATDIEQVHVGYGSSPTLSLRVPKGDYALFVSQATDTGSYIDFVEPKIVVDAPVHDTLDARDAVAIGFTVDRPEARAGEASVSYLYTAEWGQWSPILWTRDLDNTRVRPSRTSAPGSFEFELEGMLAKPDSTPADDGDFYASPYLYNLRFTDDSRVPANPRPHVADRQLAKVLSSYAMASPDSPFGLREHFLLMPLPYTMTEYYTPGTGWYKDFMDTRSLQDFPNFGIWDHMGPRSYTQGRTTKERWNVGVFGPGFSYASPTYPYSHAARLGDDVLFQPSSYNSQNVDAEGSSFYNTAVTQVLRDGEVIDEETSTGGIVTVLPPDEATYTVRVSATMARGPLSTHTDSEWTFRSAHVDGETPQPIPVLVVRFAPNLDDHNTAQAGRKFSFPVYVQRNAAEKPGKVNKPTVEISYDDGATWLPVRLVKDGDQWRAEVDHPRNAAFASLRWSVSDPDGNSAKGTTIHAYGLR